MNTPVDESVRSPFIGRVAVVNESPTDSISEAVSKLV